MLILVIAQCFRSRENGTKLWAGASKMCISSQILQGCWIPKTSAVMLQQGIVYSSCESKLAFVIAEIQPLSMAFNG